jgi:hypothetical protein
MQKGPCALLGARAIGQVVWERRRETRREIEKRVWRRRRLDWGSPITTPPGFTQWQYRESPRAAEKEGPVLGFGAESEKRQGRRQTPGCCRRTKQRSKKTPPGDSAHSSSLEPLQTGYLTKRERKVRDRQTTTDKKKKKCSSSTSTSISSK